MFVIWLILPGDTAGSNKLRRGVGNRCDGRLFQRSGRWLWLNFQDVLLSSGKVVVFLVIQASKSKRNEFWFWKEVNIFWFRRKRIPTLYFRFSIQDGAETQRNSSETSDCYRAGFRAFKVVEWIGSSWRWRQGGDKNKGNAKRTGLCITWHAGQERTKCFSRLCFLSLWTQKPETPRWSSNRGFRDRDIYYPER